MKSAQIREIYNRALLAAHRSGDPDIIAQVEDAHARIAEEIWYKEVHDI